MISPSHWSEAFSLKIRRRWLRRNHAVFMSRCPSRTIVPWDGSPAQARYWSCPCHLAGHACGLQSRPVSPATAARPCRYYGIVCRLKLHLSQKRSHKSAPCWGGRPFSNVPAITRPAKFDPLHVPRLPQERGRSDLRGREPRCSHQIRTPLPDDCTVHSHPNLPEEPCRREIVDLSRR